MSHWPAIHTALEQRGSMTRREIAMATGLPLKSVANSVARDLNAGRLRVVGKRRGYRIMLDVLDLVPKAQDRSRNRRVGNVVPARPVSADGAMAIMLNRMWIPSVQEHGS